MFHSHQIPIVKSTSRIPVYIETWDIVMKPHFPRTLACYACASLLYNKILYFSPEGTSLMTTRPEWSRKHDGCETLQQSLFISAVSTSRAGQLRRGSGVEPLCETEPKTQAWKKVTKQFGKASSANVSMLWDSQLTKTSRPHARSTRHRRRCPRGLRNAWPEICTVDWVHRV